MNYIVPGNADVRTVLRNLKECDGSVVVSADLLRSWLHELQIRRKQMSRPRGNPQKNTEKK
jgi:hypothetical protein